MRPRARLALLLAALAALVLAFSLRGNSPPAGTPLVPDAELPDPYAWSPDVEDDFVRRAATGTSHVLYARSPDGAAATAARVAPYRELVETAARSAGIDPDLLEGLVFLESAGRPDAMASDTEGAVGLTQILAETGQNLLGMRVDVERSAQLTRKIERRRAHGRDTSELERERRRADERYDPPKALAGTARYLTIAQEELGRDDLALVSYHMGIGNLQGVLRAYGEDEPSYAELYFGATPSSHPEVVTRLMRFGDDSSNYLWKVHAAAEIMRLHRDDPAELARRQALHGAKNSAEEVLHPPGSTPAYADAEALRGAWDDDALRAFPNAPATTGLARHRRMGELAQRLGAEPSLYQGLRPEALALALYIGLQVRAYGGTDAPLFVTSTVRDQAYQDLLVRRNREATRNFSLHTTGWAFDVARRYATARQAIAFQYVLDRLQALDVIAWVREPEAIHITAGAGAEPLLPLLDRIEP